MKSKNSKNLIMKNLQQTQNPIYQRLIFVDDLKTEEMTSLIHKT